LNLKKILIIFLVVCVLIVGGCKPKDKKGSSEDSLNGEDKTYTVTWKNWDGSVLELDEKVKEGSLPTYDGATPFRESDDNYSYSWSGWGPAVVNVTADITYTATYDKKALSTVKTEVTESEFNDALKFENKNFCFSMVSPKNEEQYYTYYYQMENHNSYTYRQYLDDGDNSYIEVRAILQDGDKYTVYYGKGERPLGYILYDMEWQEKKNYSFEDIKEDGLYGDLNDGLYVIEHYFSYSDFSYDSSSKTYKGDIIISDESYKFELTFENNNLVKVLLMNDDEVTVTIELSKYGKITQKDIEESQLKAYIDSKNISAENLLKLLDNVWSRYNYNEYSIYFLQEEGLSKRATYNTEYMLKDPTSKEILEAYKNEVTIVEECVSFSQLEYNGSTYVKQADYQVYNPFTSPDTYVKNSQGNYVHADDDHQYTHYYATPVGQAFAECMLIYKWIKDNIDTLHMINYSVDDYVVTFSFSNFDITIKYKFDGLQNNLTEFVCTTSNSTCEETLIISNIKI